MRNIRLLATLLALVLLPTAAANAAPKKVRFSFNTAAASVNEAAGTYTLTVQRSLRTSTLAQVAISVDPSTTAVAGTDYDFTNPGTITFNPGETRKTFPVTIHDDSVFNSPNKKIVFKLTPVTPPPGPSVQVKNSPLTVTILDNDGPGTIDFSQASYSVIESAGIATITVARNGNPLLSESVDYATSDGTATAGSDYSASSGTVTFAVNEMSKTFSVPITDDQSFEGDETVHLTLSNAKNLTNPLQAPNLGPSSPATLTIVDDDVPTFAFSHSTYSVGEADTTFDVTVVRGGATYVPADVGYRVDPVTPGTATSGSDYDLTAGSVHFNAGETTKTFAVTIHDDALNEGNETVNLQLVNGSDVVDASQLSILDDDNPLASVQFSQPSYDVNEADTTATVTVTASKDHDADITVPYATADDSATNGATNPDGSGDYVDTHGTLTIPAHQLSATISIPLNPDDAVEGDEDFTIALGTPTNGASGDPATATINIADDDTTGTLELSAARYDVNENAGHATITVNRVGGSGGPASVDYSTTDGTAQAPGDYAATSGTLSFANGETQKTFQIPVVWDGRQEGDETVSVELSNFNSDDDQSAVKVAVLHIADDGASGPVQFDAPAYSVVENAGAATVTVKRSGGGLGGPVTVDYATSDGTAHAGADYTAAAGTLTFAAGEASRSFQVPVNNDTVHQGARSLNLTLSNPGGGTSLGGQSSASLTIGDDDPISSPSTDKTAPKLKLTAKKVQKLKTKRLVLKVHSNEKARLVIKANLRKGKKLVKVASKSARIGAGKTITIKLKLSKKSLTRLRAALVKGKGAARITFAVTGTDAAGNRATVRRTITLKK